jgi:hypothetical protein
VTTLGTHSFKAAASIQDLMDAIIDPAGDALWDSVGSVSTQDGTVEKQPRSDDEWEAVRLNALRLIEGSNLLMMEGRQVAVANRKLEDAHVSGILAPQEIQQIIDADRAAFILAAQRLQDAGAQALSAIEAKDPVRLMAAGDKIDDACERCHSVYWYPKDQRPGEKWPALTVHK